MKFQRRTAIHIGGAGWLILCATGSDALAQEAAAATQLPDITVTAPSPNSAPPCRRSDTRAGARRPYGARPQSRAQRTVPADASARCSCASTGRASDRYRSIRHRHRSAERGDPPRGRRPARRSPVLQTRHYRLDLRAGRLEPADHPRPRRQPRRHCRKWHSRRRRLRPRRGPFRAGRPDRDQPG